MVCFSITQICMLTNTNIAHSPDLNSLGFLHYPVDDRYFCLDHRRSLTNVMVHCLCWQCWQHPQSEEDLWVPHPMELVLLSKGCTWDWQRHLNVKQQELQGCTPCEVLGFVSAWEGCGCLAAGTTKPRPALLSLTLQTRLVTETGLGEPCLVWGHLPGESAEQQVPSPRSTGIMMLNVLG